MARAHCAACLSMLVVATVAGVRVGSQSAAPFGASPGNTSHSLRRLDPTAFHRHANEVVCLPVSLETARNATTLLRGHVGRALTSGIVVEDANHLGLLNAIAGNNVFATMYTTWCANCIMWLRQGGPLDQIVDIIDQKGLGGQVKVFKVNIERADVDRAMLQMQGFGSMFVPAIFAVKKGTDPVIYSGTSMDRPEAIFAWLAQQLDLAV